MPLPHALQSTDRPLALPMRRRRLRIALLSAALAWACFVLARYYVRLWSLPAEGVGPLGLHLNRSLPYLGEALRHAAVSIGCGALLMGSALVLGLGISRAAGWAYDSWREAAIFAASLGIGAFAYLGMALSAVGQYRPGTLWALTLAPPAAAAIWWGARGRRLPRPTAARPRLPAGAGRLWALVILLSMLLAAVAALAPEVEYDALWYHLAYPQRALSAGALVDLPHDYVSLYPMTWELWFGYGLAIGGQAAAKMLHFACLPLGALLSYEMTRRFVPAASPWLAAALFVTIPTVLWEASTAYVDLALALHVGLALYALLRYKEQERRQWLLLAALNMGLALASKHLALFALAICGLGLLIALWRADRRAGRLIIPLLIFGALSMLLPLPWYVRSWRASGNPVFPELYTIFGAPADRWGASSVEGLSRFLQHFGRERTPLNLLTLPWHMTMHAASYDGALGPLFLILLPALALVRMRRGLPWIAGFSALFVALWASPISSFQLRFLVLITPMLAVLGAAAFARLAALARAVGGRRAAGAASGLLGLLLILNLPPFTALHEVDRVGYQGWLNSVLHGVPISVVIGGEPREGYIGRVVRSYPAWQFANAALPADARVLSWDNGDNFYSQSDRLWINATLARKLVWADPGQEAFVLGELRRLGITHLMVAKRDPAGWGSYVLTSPPALAGWYDRLYEDDSSLLLRVRWEILDRAP